MKKDSTARLIEIKNELSAFPKFKGKAGMVRNISNKLDFLATHKTEPHLEVLFIKEAVGLRKKALEALSE